jgi:hypothetical protein
MNETVSAAKLAPNYISRLVCDLFLFLVVMIRWLTNLDISLSMEQ